MTNEEAIETLQTFSRVRGGDEKESMMMAIKALHKEVIKWESSAEKKGSAERDFLSPSAKKTDLTEYAGACSIAEKLVMRQI